MGQSAPGVRTPTGSVFGSPTAAQAQEPDGYTYTPSVLSLLQWLIDRLLSPLGRRRAFDAHVVDRRVRHYDAITAGMVAILNRQRPRNPFTAGDTTYVSAESIGDDASVIRLTMLFAKIQRLGESGQRGTYPGEKRRLLREDLIDAMSDVRAAAIRRRRTL